MSVRVAIAGIGAANYEIQAVRQHPELELAALADVDAALLAEATRRYAVPAVPDVASLCSREDVDAVYIGTPTHLHTEHALQAIERSKHVIVAKPMALNLGDAARMIEAAERRGVRLMVGHTQSYEPAIAAMRSIIASGELGPLGMIATWYFTDWIYRGRQPSELDVTKGGGVVYRQGAHQFDIVRVLGGGLVRSVRAMAGAWDRDRPAEGAYAAFLEFEDGAAATAVFNGYDHFRTTDIGFPIGEGGNEVGHDGYSEARSALNQAGASGELALKKERRQRESAKRHQAFYGLTIVSCHRGDIRQSPDGLLVYGDDGLREVAREDARTGRDLMMDELYQAIAHKRLPAHNGRWGMATLEVQLAVLQSSRDRREIALSHQVPFGA